MATNVEFNILQNVKDFTSHKYFRYFLYLPAVILLYALTKKWFIYSIFIIFNGFIIYYSKLYHLPIDVSPLFFLEVVITRYYGLKWTLIFIFLSYIIPKTMAGSSMNWMSYIFISIGLVPVIGSLFFKSVPLIYVGFASSVVQYIGGVIFQLTMKPLILCLGDGIANVLNNLIWFLIFSDLIVLLF